MEIKDKQGKLRTKNPANPLRKEEDKPKKLVYYVGFDAVLATYDRWGHIDDIGEPIEKMKKRVLEWIKEGVTIKIFTARASDLEATSFIRKWLFLNGLLLDLEITNILGDDCDMIFSDKSREVIHNTGVIVSLTKEFKGEQSVK